MLVSVKLQAQTPASATWALSSAAAGQTAATTGNITARNQSLTGMAVSAYLSSERGQRLSDTYANWPADTKPQAGRHIDYIVAPKNSEEMLITAVSLDMAFNSSAACKVNISWSADGVNFNDVVTAQAIESYSIHNAAVTYNYKDLSLFVPAGKSLTLRISPWVTSAQANKYFVSKNVTVAGITGVKGTLSKK